MMDPRDMTTGELRNMLDDLVAALHLTILDLSDNEYNRLVENINAVKAELLIRSED